MFQVLIGALGAFVGLSVGAAAGRKFYDCGVESDEFRYFIAACLQVLLGSSTIALILALLFREEAGTWLGLNTQWVLWAVFVSAASVIVQIRLVQWQVRKEARRYGALQVSQSVLNMLLALLLVVGLQSGADGRMFAQVLTVGAIAFISLVFLQRDHLLGFFVWKPEYVREVWAFGAPLIPHIAGAFVLTSIDRLVVKQELGLADAGIYMVAVQLASVLSLIFDAVNRAYTPLLYEILKKDLLAQKLKLVRYSYLWFGLLLLGAMLTFIVGPFFVRLVAGEQYEKAGEIIGWLAMGQAFMGMYLVMTGYIFYSKRTGLLSLTTITSGLINVALLVVLVRLLGLKGAAIAFSISMGIRFLLTWWVAQRRHPMPWFNFKVQN